MIVSTIAITRNVSFLQSRPGKRARTEDLAQSGLIAIQDVPCIGTEITIDQDVPCLGGGIIIGEMEDNESQVGISLESTASDSNVSGC